MNNKYKILAVASLFSFSIAYVDNVVTAADHSDSVVTVKPAKRTDTDKNQPMLMAHSSLNN